MSPTAPRWLALYRAAGLNLDATLRALDAGASDHRRSAAVAYLEQQHHRSTAG